MGFAEFLGLTAPKPEHRAVALSHRVEVLEAQVAALMQRTGLDPARVRVPTPWSAEVEALARSGNKIQAIKLHREQTGLGLAEAKAVVDQIC